MSHPLQTPLAAFPPSISVTCVHDLIIPVLSGGQTTFRKLGGDHVMLGTTLGLPLAGTTCAQLQALTWP